MNYNDLVIVSVCAIKYNYSVCYTRSHSHALAALAYISSIQRADLLISNDILCVKENNEVYGISAVIDMITIYDGLMEYYNEM